MRPEDLSVKKLLVSSGSAEDLLGTPRLNCVFALALHLQLQLYIADLLVIPCSQAQH